ncbi:integrator complex subunit [Achlya hypogyna]|uniref:Integrator complex subunit n=1 Tax=Achlya hypogyna TaxID=1202772 RepID=A0A1V9Y661_ACHHY|nr:integrator complex subunit [Achlya hypogyna]
MSFLGLPLLTERTAFRGAIYATEPCARLGRLLLLEILELLERKRMLTGGGSKPWLSRSNIKDLPAVEQTRFLDLELDKWVEPYTRHEIESCLERLTYITYKETISFSYELKITAVSSGFALGSCSWMLESANEKLVYVPTASSEMNRHPTALDIESFTDCDILLLTDMKVDRSPLVNTTAQIEAFLNHALRVYARGGCSLVPCTLDGVFFDLMENWELFLRARHHTPIPVYLVSPVGAAVCDAVFGPQWLCDSKIDKICAGEPAFVHSTMLQRGHLRLLPTASGALAKALEEPCLIFVSDPSLRLGAAATVLGHLAAKPVGAAVIGIDPHVSPGHALAPFQPLHAVEVIHAPIDMRLSCNDANTLVTQCLPQHLLVPECFTRKHHDHEQSVRWLHELVPSRATTSTTLLRTLEPVVVTKPAKKNIDAVLDPKLAAQTQLTLIDKNAAALVQTQIELGPDQCVLKPVPFTNVPMATGSRATKRLCVREVANVLLGDLNPHLLIQALEVAEFGGVHSQEQDGTLVLSFRDTVVTYVARDNKTSITSSDEGIRDLVGQLVLGQLSVLPY